MSNFKTTIENIDWNNLRDAFTSQESLFGKAEEKFQLLAHWSKAIETIYSDNIALPFIREAQISSQDFFCSCSLALYKCSASSIRTIFESVLYFSYFKDHVKELDSVVKRNLYMSRASLIDYHINHTDSFESLYTETNLKSELESIYKEVSSIVHGQKPGTWHSTHKLENRQFEERIAVEAVNLYCRTIDVINLLLLCTISYSEWITISPISRKFIIATLKEDQIKLIDKHVI
ncbi:hypothetical protein ACOKV8_004582 [Vibrio parahaemolyticus]